MFEFTSFASFVRFGWTLAHKWNPRIPSQGNKHGVYGKIHHVWMSYLPSSKLTFYFHDFPIFHMVRFQRKPLNDRGVPIKNSQQKLDFHCHQVLPPMCASSASCGLVELGLLGDFSLKLSMNDFTHIASIYIHLHPFTSIYIHLHPFTSIYIHLHPFTSIYSMQTYLQCRKNNIFKFMCVPQW